MSLEIKGKVIEVLETRTGSSDKGDWAVQSWVLEETEGQYPKKIAFEAFNKNWDIKVGQEINVGINLESREYNGKWYNSIKAWKMDIIGDVNHESLPTQPITEQTDINELGEDTLPF